MVVSCGHDEKGGYRGGKAGDQTGTEYYKRAWYARDSSKANAGWDCVLRYPDEAVGKRIALLSEQAAANNHIGYDQNQRSTFYAQLKAFAWCPNLITVDCESDCSASTAAVIIATGHQLGIQALADVPYTLTTYNMKSALVKAGFKVLNVNKYLSSDKYLKAGDIILNEAHHVVVNVDDGSLAGGSATKTIKNVTPYAGVVNVSDYLNVRVGAGTEYETAKLGDKNDKQPVRLPNGMVVSIDKECDGWGHLTNTGDYWVYLKYITK